MTVLERERLDDDGAPVLDSGLVRWSTHDPLYDGSWWPGSADAVAELQHLIPLVRQHSGIAVNRVSLHLGDWTGPQPRHVHDGPRLVRLGWFHTLPVRTATLGRGSDPRLVLHVHPCTEVPS